MSCPLGHFVVFEVYMLKLENSMCTMIWCTVSVLAPVVCT